MNTSSITRPSGATLVSEPRAIDHEILTVFAHREQMVGLLMFGDLPTYLENKISAALRSRSTYIQFCVSLVDYDLLVEEAHRFEIRLYLEVV